MFLLWSQSIKGKRYKKGQRSACESIVFLAFYSFVSRVLNIHSPKCKYHLAVTNVAQFHIWQLTTIDGTCIILGRFSSSYMPKSWKMLSISAAILETPELYQFTTLCWVYLWFFLFFFFLPEYTLQCSLALLLIIPVM